MNRKNFLRSLFTVVAAPSVLAEIHTIPKNIDSYYISGDDIVTRQVGNSTVWMRQAEVEAMQNWYKDAERQMWFGSASPKGKALATGVAEQLSKI